MQASDKVNKLALLGDPLLLQRLQLLLVFLVGYFYLDSQLLLQSVLDDGIDIISILLPVAQHNILDVIIIITVMVVTVVTVVIVHFTANAAIHPTLPTITIVCVGFVVVI